MVEIHVRCSFSVNTIGFHTSLPMRKVRAAPTLMGTTPADRFSCRRNWPFSTPRPPFFLSNPPRAKPATLGGCTGVVAHRTRVTIKVALKRLVCRPRRLRVRVEVEGGIDCRGSAYACPSVGYVASLARKVAGC